jgi:general nucleoside transport system permease protein
MEFWITSLLMGTFRVSLPLVFTALGGLLSERSGVVNIALEGFMLTGAFTAASIAHFTQSSGMGLGAAAMVGFLFAALYAFFVIRLKADQIVTGTAINIFAMGLAPFISKILFDSTGSTASLPLEIRFSYELYALALIVLFLLYYVYHYTRAGLWLQFAGEHPESLLTAGVSPNRVRYIAVSLSGALAAIGGATLSLFLSSSYSPMMTGGRGFMALAALILGRWRPVPTVLACLFFAATESLQIRLQGVEIDGQLIPVQFIQILPYIITLIAVAGFFGNSRAPKSLGTAFEEV